MRYTIAFVAICLVLGAQATLPEEQVLENFLQTPATIEKLVATGAPKGTQYNPSSTLMTGSLGSFIQAPLTGTKGIPMTMQAAIGAGWQGYKAQSGEAMDDCIPGLGRLYYRPSGVTSEAQRNGQQISAGNSIAVYYAMDGKIAGVRVNIFGKQDETLFSKGIGNAAPDKLVDQGFWIKDFINDGWYMNVAFRAPDMVCNSSSSGSDVIGDRLVINQQMGGIARMIPLTAAEAKKEKFQAGSCMKKMGQHWLYDLDMAPQMSWHAKNLMPVVPMYHLVGENKGKLNAFFFTSPVCQNKDSGDWDVVPIPGICALTASMMCENLCNSKCGWNTSWWATKHVFFTRNLDAVTCPNPVGITEDALLFAAGGSCPANTPTPVRPNDDPNK